MEVEQISWNGLHTLSCYLVIIKREKNTLIPEQLIVCIPSSVLRIVCNKLTSVFTMFVVVCIVVVRRDSMVFIYN